MSLPWDRWQAEPPSPVEPEIPYVPPLVPQLPRTDEEISDIVKEAVDSALDDYKATNPPGEPKSKSKSKTSFMDKLRGAKKAVATFVGIALIMLTYVIDNFTNILPPNVASWIMTAIGILTVISTYLVENKKPQEIPPVPVDESGA